MAIAEAIGTAIGETVGRAYKVVSDLSVDSLLELFNSDNTSSRKQELSFVDNINQAKKAHYEGEMARKTVPVENSCLKYESHITVNSDGVTSSDLARRAFIGEYNVFRDLEPYEAKYFQAFASYQKQVDTGESFLDGDTKIDSPEKLEMTKNEIDNTVGALNESLNCVEQNSCNDVVDNQMVFKTNDRSKNLTHVMRAKLAKAVLSDEAASRFSENGANNRIDMLRAQISSSMPGGKTTEEVNSESSIDTPLIKEVIGNAMLQNQLYIELIFEEEKRIIQEALKLQLLLEGQLS